MGPRREAAAGEDGDALDDVRVAGERREALPVRRPDPRMCDADANLPSASTASTRDEVAVAVEGAPTLIIVGPRL